MWSSIYIRLGSKARLRVILWGRLLGLLLVGEVGAFNKYVRGGVWFLV